MAFATAADLASYLQAAQVDTYTAELVLDMASDAIKTTTRQTVERVTDDTVLLPAPAGDALVLPDIPADAPSAVLVGGTAVTDYYVDTDRYGRTTLVRPAGWQAWDATTGTLRRVSVTYSHGYDPVPGEIKRVCLQAAARAYRNPEGLRSETTGSESYTYATETVQAVDLTDDEVKAVRRAVGYPAAVSVPLRT